MGPPKYWRQAVADLELALPEYAPEHNYLVHNALLPLPSYVKKLNFHGIVIGTTFLNARHHPIEYNLRIKNYDFIRYSDAYKIALPQDDYYSSSILDKWMTHWRVDKIYTVCSENWDILYPEYIRSGGTITLGYTGYITPTLRKRAKTPKPHKERPIDICYRASGHPTTINKLCMLKAEIGTKFKNEFKDYSFITDISVNEKDIIPGSKWLDFIESSKFILGTNSGSSLLDPYGKFRSLSNSYLSKNPNASYEQIESACFPDQDGKYVFTAISPRVFEAGLLKTGQILIPGEYSGLIKPWEHYIPLMEDFSNKDEVGHAVKDLNMLEKITNKCREKLLSSPQIMVENHVSKLISDIEGKFCKGDNPYEDKHFQKAITQHAIQMRLLGSILWPFFPIARNIYRETRTKIPSFAYRKHREI